jgi:putative oxidoreductase
MQSTINKFGPLLGRILLGLIFLLSGLGKIGSFAGTAGWMTSKGLPMAEVLLAITMVIEIGASLMIIGGFKARLGAAALFLWMIPVTFLFHNFWSMPAAEQQIQMIMFMKNLGLMGGMLYIMTFGSGPMSLDRK